MQSVLARSRYESKRMPLSIPSTYQIGPRGFLRTLDHRERRGSVLSNSVLAARKIDKN